MTWCDGTDHSSLERGICPVPLPLLGLATAVYGHQKDGQRESPALAVTAKGQGQLCSFRAFEPFCAHGETRVPELTAQQPAAGCSVPLPQEGPCPTAGGSAGTELCPVPDPQTQPIPTVLLLVGGLPVGSFSPLALLAGNLPFSLLAWCPLSMAGALPPVCSRASFPFREKLDGPCFWPACSMSTS